MNKRWLVLAALSATSWMGCGDGSDPYAAGGGNAAGGSNAAAGGTHSTDTTAPSSGGSNGGTTASSGGTSAVDVIDFESPTLPTTPTTLQRALTETLPDGVPADSETATTLPFSVGFGDFSMQYTPGWDSWTGFALSANADTETPGYANQYSSVTGGGADGSKQFAVVYYSSWGGGRARIDFKSARTLLSVDATNGTYGYLAMRNGTQFGTALDGKKRPAGDSGVGGAGGAAATDTVGPERNYCIASFIGVDDDGAETGSATQLLGAATDSGIALVSSWAEVDLRGLGSPRALELEVYCSDDMQPTYVLIDNLRAVH